MRGAEVDRGVASEAEGVRGGGKCANSVMW